MLPRSFNRLRDPLQVMACWSLGGSTFGFSDAYIPRSAREAFVDFAGIYAAHRQCPVALFGHTDSSGTVGFNHDLSWARAQTTYGVLRNDPDIWVTLYGDGDAEGRARLKTQLLEEGYEVDPKEKGVGATMTAAITEHVAYLAGELALDVNDFLGEHGQFSMQACSEFNPLRRLGASILERCTPQMRAAALATNRRVVAYLFEPGIHVDGAWPCPVPGEGPVKCGKRLWSDAKKRRSSKDPTREFWPAGVKGSPYSPIVRSEETFECRFYDRVAHASPCEVAEPWKPPPEDPIIITDEPDPPEPKPPVPPKPPAPDIPHFPPPPKVPPKSKPPVVEVEWTPMVSCSHGSGTRLNSGALRALGKGAGSSGDTLQVVPGKDGDKLIVTVDPDSEFANLEVYYGMGLLSWEGSGKTSASATVDHVSTSLDHPITLYARYKVHPPSKDIVLKDDKRTAIVKVERFPDKRVSADAELLLDLLRAYLAPFIELVREAGEVFSDDFTFRALEDDDTQLEFSAAWKEWPAAAFDPEMDYRVFFSYSVLFALDPLFSAKGTLKFTALQFLKRLRRYEWISGPVDKLLSYLPEWVLNVLEALRIEVTPTAGGGGRFETIRERPDEEILEVSDRKGADHWEIPAFVEIEAVAEATLEKLLERWVEDASVSFSAKFSAEASVGLIADMVRDEAGFYAEAAVSDLDVKVAVAFPFGLRKKAGFKPIRAKRWGPERWIVASGDGT